MAPPAYWDHAHVIVRLVFTRSFVNHTAKQNGVKHKPCANPPYVPIISERKARHL